MVDLDINLGASIFNSKVNILFATERQVVKYLAAQIHHIPITLIPRVLWEMYLNFQFPWILALEMCE